MREKILIVSDYTFLLNESNAPEWKHPYIYQFKRKNDDSSIRTFSQAVASIKKYMNGVETSIRNEVRDLKEEIDANEYLVRDVDKRVKKIH